MKLSKLSLLIAVVGFVGTAWAETATPLPLPDGRGGIGFDDLRYDAASGTLLIPAGRTGNVDLVDPTTKAVTPIPGFSKIATYDAGHGQSVTSVDAGEGWLFATDRTALSATRSRSSGTSAASRSATARSSSKVCRLRLLTPTI